MEEDGVGRRRGMVDCLLMDVDQDCRGLEGLLRSE